MRQVRQLLRPPLHRELVEMMRVPVVPVVRVVPGPARMVVQAGMEMAIGVDVGGLIRFERPGNS